MESKHILKGPKPLSPIPNISLGKYLFECLKKHGSKVAQIDAITGETRTFNEILTKSLSIAEHLYTRGIRCGDVVGICSENSLDFTLPVIATYFVGATCATFNPTYTTNELHHTMNISKPRIVFCSEYSLERIEMTSRESEFLKDIVVFGVPSSHKHIPFSELLSKNGKYFEPVEINHKDLEAVILCSSGTTGLPKGVMLTHDNFLFVFGYLLDHRYGDMRKSDTMLALLPMFHAFMFILQLAGLISGLTTVILKKFEEGLFLKSIQNHRVTLIYLVPPIIVFLAKAAIVDKYDLSSVRDIVCGAAPLKEEIEILASKRLKLQHIRQGYGLTEATLAVTMTPSDRKKRGASGVLVPDTECKVVDRDTGKVLGLYESGELCFRGPGNMKGYCGNLQETSASFDEDGFLHTGDVGYYDKEGFFFIVDRVKELIKYKGFQVPPAELEALLLTHPAVQEAAVTGVPDENAGELPLAFIVKQPGAKVTKEEIIKFVAGKVSPQKRLHGGVIFTDSIPKTPSGKILRRELKTRVKAKL